ncbi:MAG: 7,8-didemethyl-8-hydroxy-5-deazariboflavin synthase subunit CofG [Methanobrevibacter sp.]|uniref:7,8-didemethyl-8-hydroxy-5-deazariboflavin synthase subunit CofG n=1 Tax=Methanobrevibacter sp. TaxID=66852 RepID=UPI0026E0DD79|nr:7,8-didemethyl-8-hydroxy-5-deazariboflavin synthase subunit CofG [Methanobrevibacter sp.]MDO5848112.1 7,8-didemethyl-8-hydroxy-5-deazariboflavin synthase subunit CofG [Methanobrevibacter sp.]
MNTYSKEELVSFLKAEKGDLTSLLSKITLDEEFITYSKNVFIPLTKICKNDCGYCNFKRTPEDDDVIILKTKDEVLYELKQAEKYGCKEALFTYGEDADEEEVVKRRLTQLGYDSMTDYVVDICRMTLDETSLLPHSNGGNYSYEDLKKLKEVNASMGMMLENSSPRLMNLPAHNKSPGKDPKRRIETIANAGRLKIPYTTGILIGIGETKEEIVDSLLTIRDLYDKYGHIQEVIIQNFTPSPGIEMEDEDTVSLFDMMKAVLVGKIIFADTPVSIQIPPNLNYDTAQIFLLCGADDWGGVSPVSIDFVNPTSPWPTLDELRKITENAGYELRERLCIYEHYINSQWLNEELLEKCKKLL